MNQAQALERVAADWIGQPRVWGSRDCVHLVMAMRAEIGKPIRIMGGASYTTEAGGLRVLKRKGYGSLQEAAAAYLGEELPTPLFARPGDVLAFPVEGAWGCGLGLCLPDHRILMPGGLTAEEGYFLPLGHVDPATGKSMCITGWRLV